MAKAKITSKDTIRQERKERPPLALICAGSKIVENPSNIDIIDEINLTVIPQVRVVYDLFMTNGEGCFDYPKGKAAVANSLFVAIERLEMLLNYLPRGGAT